MALDLEEGVNHMKSRLIQETVGYDEACEVLEMGRNKILELCEKGDLAYTIHAGRKRIYLDSIEEYSERVREKAIAEAKKRRALA